MDPHLFRYVWRKTRGEQVWILFVIIASMPFGFVMLDLPKYIVNGPILNKGFDAKTLTQHYFQVEIPTPTWLFPRGSIPLLPGLDLDRLHALIVLSAAFLALVIINGLFKFYINTFKGRLGERMLGQLRFELIDRILRFPPAEARRLKAAEVATMIKDEVEPMGGFIGDAFVQPVFLGGQIVVSLVFILAQNISLGMIALVLLLVQGVLIPRLRRKQLLLGRERQLTARALAGRIGEIVEDMNSIHTNGVSNYQRADIVARLTTIFGIRFALYQWKFFVKFLNNLLAQITPFLFYLVGGFLAILGLLDVGQLVAVISAYKDLPSPVKDLIDWDQQRLDVEIKYAQVIEQFSLADTTELLPETLMEADLPHLEGELCANGLAVIDHTGARLLDNLSFTMALTDSVGLLGSTTSGGETLTEVVARLVHPTSGRLTIGGQDIKDMSRAQTGRRIAFVAPETFLQQSDIADALLYGLRHTIQHASPPSKASARRHEIIRIPGVDLDFSADWVDYEAAGATGPEDIGSRLKAILALVELEDDVVSLGLNRRLRQPDDELQRLIVSSRATFRDRLAQAGLQHLVEPFDPERYNSQATIAENVVFGTPIGDGVNTVTIAHNPLLRSVLERDGLTQTLFDMGRDIATTIMDVFEGLDANNPLFNELSLMSPEAFPTYVAALKQLGSGTFKVASAHDRDLFVDLAFAYIEPRDRLGLLDDALKDRLVEARKAFHAALEGIAIQIAFYDPATYNIAASVQDNILLGRIAFGIAEANQRINTIVRSIVDDLGLRAVVFEAGLTFDIGTSGKRLTNAQRQKLALARALLRRPDLLVAHRPLSHLDGSSQTLIAERVLALAKGQGGGPSFGVLWNLENPNLADRFDRVLTLERGQVVKEARREEKEPEPLRASA